MLNIKKYVTYLLLTAFIVVGGPSYAYSPSYSSALQESSKKAYKQKRKQFKRQQKQQRNQVKQHHKQQRRQHKHHQKQQKHYQKQQKRSHKLHSRSNQYHSRQNFQKTTGKTRQVAQKQFRRPRQQTPNRPLQIRRSNGSDVLDSHGLTHKQARQQVDQYISNKRDNKPFTVITGKGLHGRHQPFAMKNNITQHTNNSHRNWKVVNDPHNSGRVFVYPNR